ncbi:hypothetical protein THIOKS1630008 [Thiocapsa sp. KS1]|nr:hypothetical protein THIOKS1630008 [Thiocapsa sp. KS1]
MRPRRPSSGFRRRDRRGAPPARRAAFGVKPADGIHQVQSCRSMQSQDHEGTIEIIPRFRGFC